MGDKSPKSKQRTKNQKDAAKTRSKNEQERRQVAFSSLASLAKKKQ